MTAIDYALFTWEIKYGDTQTLARILTIYIEIDNICFYVQQYASHYHISPHTHVYETFA